MIRCHHEAIKFLSNFLAKLPDLKVLKVPTYLRYGTIPKEMHHGTHGWRRSVPYLMWQVHPKDFFD